MIHWTEKHSNEIEIFMHHRFTMEQQLAKELLYEFDHNPLLIDPLKEMAYAALEDLGTFPPQSVQDALRDEAAMGVLFKYRNTKVWDQTIINDLKLRKLSAEHCSDIIRLYGAAVEKAGAEKGASRHFKAMAEEKKFTRPEPKGGGFEKKMGIWDGSADKQTKEPIAPFRRRKPPSPETINDYQTGYKQSLTGGPGAQFMHPTLQKLTYGQGILLKQAASGSTVLKMDRTFGLPIGADISGTTADSIYFINKFGKLVGATDPIYQLLPLASLVFNYHHSLLEVALALTLNKIIEYTVGFYSTLKPLNTKHAAMEDILDKLLEYENRPDNKHILIYYNRQAVKGCYHFERGEDDLFRRVGTASFDYWNTFPNFQDYPPQVQVNWLLARKGLKTNADQARSPETVYGDQLSRR